MNTLNSVYETINKLSDKTELAKHEVELGVIQDEINNVASIVKKFNEGFLVISFARQKALPIIKNSIENANKFLTKFEQTKKTAKELGVDLPNEYLKLETQAGTIIGEGNDIITWINKF